MFSIALKKSIVYLFLSYEYVSLLLSEYRVLQRQLLVNSAETRPQINGRKSIKELLDWNSKEVTLFIVREQEEQSCKNLVSKDSCNDVADDSLIRMQRSQAIG